MIDLSYLTEEEQEMIMAVLKRDTELKKAEEERIKKLQKTERDKGKLKYLTGEWFYETKSHRHRDRIHGSDIIRASMKHGNPVTILELSEIWPEKSSFLNSESKDVFIPPELSGILDEFPSQDRREDHYRMAESPQGTQTPSVQPQIKPRQNPFNSKPLGVESPKKTDGCLTSGAGETPLAPAKLQQTPTYTLRIPAEQQKPDAQPHKATAKPGQTPAESLQTPAEVDDVKIRHSKHFPCTNKLSPPHENPIPSNSNQNTDSPKTTSFTTKPQTKKKLLLYSSHDSVMDTSSDPVTRQDMSPTPRGILKQSSSSCSFTDSLSHRNSFSSQLPSPLSPENSDSSHSPPLSPSSELSSPGLLDRKQVRFSPIIQAKDTGRLEVQDSREHGDHGLLDQDCTPPFDQEGEPDTNESKNTSDPLLFHYIYNEKCIGETAPITNEGESPPSEPSILSSEKVGEFLGCGNWRDENAYTTSTIQNPFDHHEDHAEPHSSQVSEPPASVLEQGKALHISPGGQAHTLTEEEGSSIAKVLEWFGRVSKDSSKVKERPGSPEEDKENKDVPEGPDTLDTENMSPTQEEIKEKPSPKPRRGLLALFSRAETKADSPETVLTKEDVVHHPDDKKDNIISESLKAPHTPTNSEVDDIFNVQSFPKLNVVTEEHEASVLLSKTEDSGTLYDVDDDDTQQKESLDHGERSASRLASLKSFWERGNKGPKILSIKKSADTNQGETPKLSKEENKDMDLKSPGINISPFKANTSFGSSECPEDKSSPESHKRIRDGADASVSSYEEKSLTFDINQMTQEPEEHGLQTEINSEEPQSSPYKQKQDKDEIPHPVPIVRKPLTQQDTEPATISNLKSFWEKERSGPKVTVSTPESPDVRDAASPKKHSKEISESSLEVGSTTLDPVVGPERRKSSLTKEAGMIMLSLKEKIERSQRKQSPSKVPVKSPQDDTDRISHSTHHISPLKTLKAISDKDKKCSPRSSPIRNISSGALDHDHQSGDDNLTVVLVHTRTPSPRHQPKVPPRDSFPVKESRKNGSPLRAFSIDVNPTEEISAECLEDTSLNRDQIGYPTGQSHTDKSSPFSDEKDLAEHHLKVTPQQSPPSSPGKFQSSGRISIGNTGGIQTSPVHSLTSSQGQTSACLTSPEHRRKTSDEGSDGSPIMLKERKRLDDFQPNIRLARSYIPLSYQHYLGLPESTHKSGCSDQPIRQEWIRVEVGEGSEQVSQGRASNESSPSRCSQPESEEITFDSSRSASPEAWSQSRTSSVCGSVEPSPVRTVLKQANVRPISISKSLENLASLPSREERRKNEPRTDITLSVEDVSAAPLTPSSSLSDPEQMKMLSVSVPAFIQQQRNGRGSDCTSVNSFYSERQRKDSTNTYLSTSSGRASMSSVSGSVMSIYSTDFGNVEVKGTIQFAVNYVQKLGEFHIFIAQCRDLAVAEPKRNRSDPYVKCYLLPDKTRLGKRKTTVKKKTLNPAYNEILRYKIPLENLKAHTLNLSVWHNDTFGRNSFLGEVNVDLSEWDFNNTHMMDYALKGRVLAQMSPKRVNHCMEMSGEMRVALRFLQQTSQSKKTPQTGEVQIWVKECKDLPAREGAIDPFVKCTVLPDTARKSRQKTRVVKRTANPVFNHTMVYDGFRPEDLREACVELTVWDHDRLNNHFIGGIRLGLGTGKSYGSGVDWMDSNSAEAGLWKRMIESQNEWVEDVVPLRMLVMARTMSK